MSFSVKNHASARSRAWSFLRTVGHRLHALQGSIGIDDDEIDVGCQREAHDRDRFAASRCARSVPRHTCSATASCGRPHVGVVFDLMSSQIALVAHCARNAYSSRSARMRECLRR